MARVMPVVLVRTVTMPANDRPFARDRVERLDGRVNNK